MMDRAACGGLGEMLMRYVDGLMFPCNLFQLSNSILANIKVQPFAEFLFCTTFVIPLSLKHNRLIVNQAPDLTCTYMYGIRVGCTQQ